MSGSTIVLGDPGAVRVDDRGRSRAYFVLRKPAKVDRTLIAELKEIAARLSGRNVRLCLHDSPDAPFHEMVIVERRGRYYRPHKHRAKGESYHIIEGAMAAFVFDEDGRVVDAAELTPDGSFLYRVGEHTYHAVMPLTEQVIYHESKPGPFLGEADSIYPAWAPDGSDNEQVAAYTARLLRVLGGR